MSSLHRNAIWLSGLFQFVRTGIGIYSVQVLCVQPARVAGSSPGCGSPALTSHAQCYMKFRQLNCLYREAGKNLPEFHCIKVVFSVWSEAVFLHSHLASSPLFCVTALGGCWQGLAGSCAAGSIQRAQGCAGGGTWSCAPGGMHRLWAQLSGFTALTYEGRSV